MRRAWLVRFRLEEVRRGRAVMRLSHHIVVWGAERLVQRRVSSKERRAELFSRDGREYREVFAAIEAGSQGVLGEAGLRIALELGGEVL